MRLTTHCFAVTGLAYVTPWCVNAGFVAGEETTLIVDAGGNTLAAQTIHGYAATARLGNKLILINTEKHFDHIGGNSFFHGLGIATWGHPQLARTHAEFEAEIAEINDANPDPVRRERREANALFYETHLALPDHPVRAGHTFSLGGLSAEVLFTPGHTQTNLSVWVQQEGVLYTGDCVVREEPAQSRCDTPADSAALDRVYQQA